MITINAAPHIPIFSVLSGSPYSHDFPPVAVRSEIGEVINSGISAIKKDYPFVSILRRSIMPEHIHFVIFVEEGGRCNLGEIIGKLKISIGKRCVELKLIPPGISIFEEGYHDRILMKEGQLKKMLDYVGDNPRRRLQRILNRGFHSRYRIIHENGKEYEAYGNIHLLVDMDLEAVKISHSYTDRELREKKVKWKRTVENCGVLVSPFISAAEKKVRDWCADEGGRIILIEKKGFGERYSPKGRWHDMCCQGRLLLIAPLEHSKAKVGLSKDFCEQLNRLAMDVSKRMLRIK